MATRGVRRLKRARSSAPPRAPKGAPPGRRPVSTQTPRQVGARTVPATEAARHFAALIDEVRRTGRSVVVTQHGRPVCRIAPPPTPESTVESLIEALVSGPRVDPEFLETVEVITRAQPRLPRSPWDE